LGPGSRIGWGALILWGSASALAGGLLTWTDAEAIPAFARKYDMDCSHCHVIAPKLNRVGYKFHDNFTLKEAVADLSEEMRDRIKSEDPEDIHPAYWPVSIRTAGGYQYNKRDNQPTDSGAGGLETITTRTFALTRFEILAGGLFAPGISYYMSYYPEALNVGLPGQPPVHAHPGATSGTAQVGALGFAWVRFADIFGQFTEPADHPHDDAAAEHPHDAEAEQKHEHGQDLIFGSHELHLTLSGHHRLTNAPYLAYRYDPRFSLNTSEGFQLDAPQLGASLDGATPWFGYAVSVYNGTTSSADDNRALDVFATVTQEFGDQRFGVFGVRGMAPTSAVTTGGTPIAGTGKDNQPFYRFGADADLNFGAFNLMLFGLYGQDDNELFGTSSATQDAKYYSGFVEGDYMFESARTIVLGRYDLIRNLEQGISTNQKDRGDTDAITLAVRRDLVLTSRVNLQFHLEANTMRTKATAQANNDQTSNTVFAGLDWSF
jgi:hypothetical protein